MAEFLGPIANIVVREHLVEASRHGYDIRMTIDAIAKEIKDPTKATLFRQQVLPKLVMRPVS